VVRLPDPVARNRAITRGYHDLATAMAAIVGRSDANWLCFGQWASAEAGRAIRRESIPPLFRHLVGDAVSDAVAAGNAAVFGDVAPPFVSFIRAFRDEPAAAREQSRAKAILERLCQQPDMAASADMRRAFAAYTDALLLARDESPGAVKRHTERMLVANVSVGAHEQEVADPYVRRAIPGRWVAAVFATAYLGLHLENETLSLNRDVPLPAYLGGRQFPDDLALIADPEAIDLARRFGQDVSSTRDSDAPDWEIYAERMGYIFNLLRAYQQDPAIFDMPGGPDA